jgi:hypothetical protein
MLNSLERDRWLPHGDSFFNVGLPNVIKANVEYRLDDTEQVVERLRRKSNKLLLVGDYSGLINLSIDIGYQLEIYDEVSKEKIQGSLVKSWLIGAYQATRNRSADGPIPNELKESQLVSEGRVSEQAYKDVLEIWQRMSDYKTGNAEVEIFSNLEDLSIFSITGLLSPESDEYDSAYQQSRLVLMTMQGMSYEQISTLISFAQIERSSRSKTGKLPAAMSRMIANHSMYLSDTESENLYKKSIYNWGTPGERSITYTERSRGDMIRAYKAAKYVVLSGGRPPLNYGLSSRSLKKLEKLYNELHPVWQQSKHVKPEILYKNSNVKRNRYGVPEINQQPDKVYNWNSVVQGLLSVINRFVETSTYVKIDKWSS